MSQPIIIVGCGGFGREVFGIIAAINAKGEHWDVIGFVDDQPSEADRAAVAVLGSTIIGTIDDLAARREPVDATIGIGSPAARRAVEARLRGAPVGFPVLVHPDSTIGPAVRLAPGVVVASGARLSTNISVGRHVQVDQNATVGHDTHLGDYCRLNPQACVSGAVALGAGCLVGANATILQGLRVGEDAVVGAGAVVTRDVVAHTTVKGIPAS